VQLSELIAQGRLIEVRCQDCRAKTPLDPAFFLVRRGDIDLGQLGKRIHCAQCGSSDIDVSAVRPTISFLRTSQPR